MTRMICLRASSDCKRLTKHENTGLGWVIAASRSVCDTPIIGTVALFNAARSAYRKSNGEMVPWSTPVYYLIGGIMCYFVNGITAMIANTIGLEVGLDNMCKAFGMAGA